MNRKNPMKTNRKNPMKTSNEMMEISPPRDDVANNDLLDQFRHLRIELTLQPEPDVELQQKILEHGIINEHGTHFNNFFHKSNLSERFHQQNTHVDTNTLADAIKTHQFIKPPTK
jgi:hypothetical protein